MTVSAPLWTERLVLRQPNREDAEDAVALYESDRARFFGGPFNRKTAWRRFALDLGHWALQGFGMWTVRDRATNLFQGLVGLWFPEGRAEREIGWFVNAEAEGRGIAAEAARAVRADAFNRLGFPSLVSYIHPDNHRSCALAERLGAWLDEDAPRGDTDVDLVYRHPVPGGAA